MKRRELLVGVAAATPTAPVRLNRFATAFNEYVAALQAGKADVRLWRAVQEAWKSL